MTKLQDKALLATLNISQWRGTKVDRALSTEVEATHGLTKAGRYTKDLITVEELRDITHAATALRRFHNTYTLPWGNDGSRLLPSTNYFDYCQKIGPLKTAFSNAVSDFMDNYDTILENAKIRLNGQFKEKEFPTHAELAAKFSCKFTWLKIADTDFRLDLPEGDLQDLTLHARQETDDRMQAAQADSWERVKDHLLRMKEVFSAEDKRVHATLFSSLEELVGLLPKLNITQDQALNNVCHELQGLLVDPAAIRKSDTLRSDKAAEVDALLARYSTHFSV